MADTNKKITDASTITSMAGTDKVFVNSGGDLKQMELDKMVAASAPVQTLNSNLETINNSIIDTNIINANTKFETLKSGIYYINLNDGESGTNVPEKEKISDGILIVKNASWCNYFIFGYNGKIAFGQRRIDSDNISWKYGVVSIA